MSAIRSRAEGGWPPSDPDGQTGRAGVGRGYTGTARPGDRDDEGGMPSGLRGIPHDAGGGGRPGGGPAVLPVGLYSSMHATCNVRSLMYFLGLRVRHPESAYPSFPSARSRWWPNRWRPRGQSSCPSHTPRSIVMDVSARECNVPLGEPLPFRARFAWQIRSANGREVPGRTSPARAGAMKNVCS